MIEIIKKDSGHDAVDIVTVTNTHGAKAVFCSVGAGIVSVEVPDRNGRLDDVVLGYADPLSYFGDGPAAGKVPGRYANRIGGARFTLDDETYELPVNNGPNCLHGGPLGFHNLNWELMSAEGDTVVFRHIAADGEMGFPGRLEATATYRWTDDFRLELTLHAVTDKPTVVNLTNHAYWNLAGHNAGSVLDHELQIAATHWLPTDDTLVPTGILAPVEGTPMDFRTPKAIGRDIHADFDALRFGKGYDNCWTIDGYDGTMRTAAVLTESGTGRRLEVITDQPAAQVYTGNWLAGSPLNKQLRSYDDYDGVAIECQNYPDAPNKLQFPDCVLRPGEEYVRHITYSFSTLKQ